MSASDLSLFWRVHPATVLHVGSHHAEELGAYQMCGWGKKLVVWIDALPEACQVTMVLTQDLQNHRVLQAAIWREEGADLTLHVASNGQSSSLLEFGSHAMRYPQIEYVDHLKVKTRTLGSLIKEHRLPSFDFINLDIQGSELPALQGMETELSSVKYVYAEVSREMLYLGSDLFETLDNWLTDRGFVLVDTAMTRDGWGDGFWMRRELVPRAVGTRRFIRKISHMLKRTIRRLHRSI